MVVLEDETFGVQQLFKEGLYRLPMGGRIWKGHIRKEELLVRRVLREGKHSFSRARGGILLLAIGEKQDRKAGNRQPNQGLNTRS